MSTVFCLLVLENGTKVGERACAGTSPLGFTIEFNDTVYRIKKGRILKPGPTAHVADRLLLTVEEEK